MEKKVKERKQVEDQALEKQDEESAEQYGDSEDEDEDEDEDEVPVSPVPQSGSTTKSDHAQQKEVVIEEEDYDKAEDWDSEEDAEDALERDWSFWSSLPNLCRLRSFGETSDVPWTQQIRAPGYQACLQESWKAPETVHLLARAAADRQQ
jgi:hypothetical protein